MKNIREILKSTAICKCGEVIVLPEESLIQAIILDLEEMKVKYWTHSMTLHESINNHGYNKAISDIQEELRKLI